MPATVVNSKWVNGQLVYYDARYPQRWIDAVGPGVRKFVPAYGVHPVDDTTGNVTWGVVTATSAGTGTSSLKPDEAGALKVVTSGNESDGISAQVAGEAFKLTSSNQVYFGGQVQLSSVTQSELIFGLCITDTTLVGGMTDGVYFNKDDATTDIDFVVEKNSTATTSALVDTAVANTYSYLEMLWDGTSLKVYVDGVETLTATITNLPSDEYLTPSLAVINGEAAAMTALIRNWRVIQVEA